MNLPHGSRALLCVAFGAMLSAGCTRIADHQGAILDEQLVAAVQPGVDNRDSVTGTLGRPSVPITESRLSMPGWTAATSWSSRMAP